MISPDQYFMGLAVAMARRGLGQVWPNPSVGAVLVSPGTPPQILARGWTMPGGRPHAERIVLDKAGTRARGATLYVTLEPCSHHGKTPPCAEAIISAGVARVVCGITDPDSRVNGRGIELLCEAGTDVTMAVLANSVAHVTGGHIRRVMQARPWITLKLAVGSDGLVAPGDGAPVWVTGEQARAQGHLLRARADAILVGLGTLQADNPSLTCRLPGLEGRSPVRVLLDSGLKTPTDSRVMDRNCAAAPVWIVCGEDAPAQRERVLHEAGADIIRVHDSDETGLDIGHVMGALAQRGITRLLVEGGLSVAQSFLDADVIDEAVIFTGIRPAGVSGIRPFGQSGIKRISQNDNFQLCEERNSGDDVMRIYDRKPHK